MGPKGPPSGGFCVSWRTAYQLPYTRKGTTCMKTTPKAGFTIVELLIVIVVVGILAVISAVAYNGIQQRTNNTAKIATVNQLIKLIDLYTVQYGKFPVSSGAMCATQDGQCTDGSGVVNANTSGNSTLMAELRKVGTPPSVNQPAINGSYGVQYIYKPTATFNGDSAPVRIEYWLDGGSVNCGVKNISNTSIATAISSTTGFTSSASNRTTCWVRLGLSG